MKFKSIKRRIVKAFRPRVTKDEKAAALLTHHVSKGDAFNAERNWLSAIEHYRKALDLSPDLVAIWVQLGHGLRETGQLDEAELAYIRATELEPDNRDALFFLDVARSAKNMSVGDNVAGMVAEEKSLPPAEPQGFPFHPRDRLSPRASLATSAMHDSRVVLYLCGQPIGRVAADAWETGDFARRMREFYTISHPGMRNEVVSVDAAGTTLFEPVTRPLWLRDDVRSGVLQGTEFGLADIWFVNSRTLRLRLIPNDRMDDNHVLRCFQYDPDNRQKLLLLTEEPVASDIPTFIDVTLADPYLAVGFALCTEEADLVSFAMLPFPSLCRGGLHYGEVCDDAAGKPYLDALEALGSRLLAATLKRAGRPAIGHVEIDLNDATGAERIFRKSLIYWLRDVLGISLGTCHVPRDMDTNVTAYLSAQIVNDSDATPTVHDRGAVLRLTADSVPSLQCLMGDWDAPVGLHMGSFILASAIDGIPKYRLSPPRATGERVRQANGAQAFPVLHLSAAHERLRGIKMSLEPALTIRFRRFGARDETQLLAPRLPGAASTTTTAALQLAISPAISVVHHHAGSRANLAGVLEALTLQHGSGVLEILVVGDGAEADAILEMLQRFFPASGRFIQCPDGADEGAGLNLGAVQAVAEHILFLGDAVLFHEPGTLLALSSLLGIEGVASASCLLIGPKHAGRTVKLDAVCSGYIAGDAAGTDVVLENADMLLHLPAGAWPVAVNSSRLFMAHRDEWQRIGGFVEQQRVDVEELGTYFWNRAIGEGRTHLMTTSISATLLPQTDDVVQGHRAASHFLSVRDTVGEVSVTVRRLVA